MFEFFFLYIFHGENTYEKIIFLNIFFIFLIFFRF